MVERLYNGKDNKKKEITIGSTVSKMIFLSFEGFKKNFLEIAGKIGIESIKDNKTLAKKIIENYEKRLSEI